MRRLACIAAALLCATGARADSLFSENTERSGTLISLEEKQYKEGAILTVLVMESIDASTQANTNTKKESEIEAEAAIADNPFLVAEPPNGLGLISPGKLPNWSIDAENEHRATGQTLRKNKLVTTIACTVTEVYENGNLKIEGEKEVTVNREDTNIKMSGLVRARDITPQNTVRSDQIANADIKLKGKGPLWNNQRRGILTKILDWFSPF